MEDLITMTNKEMERYDIIKQLLDRQLSMQEAMTQLSLSKRQVKRIKKRVKEYGAQGVTHRLRGKESNRAIAPEMKDLNSRI